jgi:DNA-directed RNA polymerase subunit H (RpoH/RPB5)
MKQTVYVETTVVSYLTAWPSRDIIRAAQQKITYDWWHTQRSRFDLVTSELVVLEASAGDSSAAKERLEVLKEMRIVKSSAAAQQLASLLIAEAALPRIAFRDAFHVAIAATNGVDFLLTWNCTHLANSTLRDKIDEACVLAGYRPPAIGTPEQLFDRDSYEAGN